MVDSSQSIYKIAPVEWALFLDSDSKSGSSSDKVTQQLATQSGFATVSHCSYGVSCGVVRGQIVILWRGCSANPFVQVDSS